LKQGDTQRIVLFLQTNVYESGVVQSLTTSAYGLNIVLSKPRVC